MLGSDESAVLQLSGGKDSLALLYLARPHLDRITVLFGDTGAVYPHVVEFVHETCHKLGARLEVVKPALPVAEYTTMVGLPSDIVPIEAMQEFQPFLSEKAPQLVQSYLKCCSAMLFQPMTEAIKRVGAKIVLRGSKASDARVGVADRHVEDGIEYRSPLWDWTDDDVFRYLRAQGASLPKQYGTVNDSLDCWLCTAHLKHHGAAKMRFTKQHYPNLWPELSRRMSAVRAVLDGEREKIAAAFNVAG